MEKLHVTTNFNIDIEFEIPEFHRRLFAWIIDLFLVFFYLLIAFKIQSLIINWYNKTHEVTDDTRLNEYLSSALIFIPYALYHLLCEIFMNGQSIGKKVFGIRVININGSRASISQFIIRWLLRSSDFMILNLIFLLPLLFDPSYSEMAIQIILMLLGTVLFIVADILCVIITPKSQRLGDLTAGTLLIRLKQRTSLDETVFMHVADGYTPLYPQVMQLSDRDLNAIKTILDNTRRSGNYDQAWRAAEKIKDVLKIKTSQSPYEFMEVLLKDYNYLSLR